MRGNAENFPNFQDGKKLSFPKALIMHGIPNFIHPRKAQIVTARNGRKGKYIIQIWFIYKTNGNFQIDEILPYTAPTDQLNSDQLSVS